MLLCSKPLAEVLVRPAVRGAGVIPGRSGTRKIILIKAVTEKNETDVNENPNSNSNHKTESKKAT